MNGRESVLKALIEIPEEILIRGGKQDDMSLLPSFGGKESSSESQWVLRGIYDWETESPYY